ncbi:MAG: sulfotransferase family protein [Chloroflexota bacterium]
MRNDPNLAYSKLRENPRNVLWWLFHRVTASLRATPNFLIVGAQKGGTSSLYAYIAQHPDVLPAFRKEIKFFDCNYFCGYPWYLAHFPLRGKLQHGPHITGEGTPNYLFHPTALQRLALMLPQVKILILLRNPAERAYSHYQHQKRVGHEMLSFEDAIASETERLAGEAERIAADYRYPQANYIAHSYLASGRYIEQIPKVFRLFPRENVMILRSSQLYQETPTTYASVINFLGLRPWQPPAYRVFKEGKYPPMKAETRQALSRYFKPYNQALYDYLGQELGWESAL